MKPEMEFSRRNHTERVFSHYSCGRIPGIFFFADFMNFLRQRSICFLVINTIFKPYFDCLIAMIQQVKTKLQRICCINIKL